MKRKVIVVWCFFLLATGTFGQSEGWSWSPLEVGEF